MKNGGNSVCVGVLLCFCVFVLWRLDCLLFRSSTQDDSAFRRFKYAKSSRSKAVELTKT